jgi:hypothetical protein
MVVSFVVPETTSRPAPAIAGGAFVGSCSRQERTTTAPPRRVVVVVVVLRAITEIELYRAVGTGSSSPPVVGQSGAKT